MHKLSPSQKSFNLDAAARYFKSLPGSEAELYLEGRGLLGRKNEFRLGVVADPLPGHEMYRGMISIPYFRYSTASDFSVVAMRFRCFEDHEHEYHGKYNTMPGDSPRMFNTRSLQTASDIVLITEGEFDAVAAKYAGFEAVGIPGVQTWQDHYREPFLGYETVYILADGDDPGIKFGNSVATELRNSKVIVMPPGEDVNSFILKHGVASFEERILG